MTAVVAIDPSLTSTGICSDIYEGRIRSKQRGPARLAEIRNEVMRRVADLRATDLLVLIEGYSFGSKANREHLGELGGVLRVALFEADVPYVVIPPTALKKFATGKGNAGKDLVVSSVTHRVGRVFESNDIADAMALFCLGRELTGQPHPMGVLPATHLKALDSVVLPVGV